MRLGQEVEVLAPTELREHIAASARAMAALYG
ncbi:WYL domain-containing protein [Streptomyces sp. MCAF7]